MSVALLGLMVGFANGFLLGIVIAVRGRHHD